MTTSGSSPLTRGTLTFCNPPNIQCRFIPAYAGNSLRRRGKESVRPVHPRLRGELLFLIEIFAFCNGSSPLTRGTQTQPEQCFMNRRFIPAYAGNSVCSGIEAASVAVHPRLRGELMLSLDSRSNRPGSSPLTRGTHVLENGLRKFARFIPAYAGNSSAQLRFLALDAVHPRLRGELAGFRCPADD